jgi:hypothetical protein
MINASSNAGTDTNPDPEQDRPGTPLPPGIAQFLLLAQTLTAYGRHLGSLLIKPVPWFGFTTVARFFGTVDLVEILPRIQRGLMRAAALEAMLMQRAQHGRDVVFAEPPAPKATPATPPAKAAHSPSPRKTVQPPLTFANMPSMAQIEDQVRRSPVGRTIAAICLDLAIAPSLCTGPFWNRLFDAMVFFKGNLSAVICEFARRVERFEAQALKRPDLPLPERTQQGIRQALGGFVIGEHPFQAAPAAIAGPS